MLSLMLAAALLASTPGEAAACHHYSHWYYPFPQRCGAARQMVRLAYAVPNQEHPANKAATPVTPAMPLPSLARADLDGGEADEPTRAKVLLRAALEAANAH
jgi:hypothetical protein